LPSPPGDSQRFFNYLAVEIRRDSFVDKNLFLQREKYNASLLLFWNENTLAVVFDVPMELLAAVQQHLDATVRTRGYDSMLSCCSYVSSTDPTFSAEALDAAAWRDAVWRYCYDAQDDYTAGTRPVPTPDELIAELPALVW
jgi:hypothetical protein